MAILNVTGDSQTLLIINQLVAVSGYPAEHTKQSRSHLHNKYGYITVFTAHVSHACHMCHMLLLRLMH